VKITEILVEAGEFQRGREFGKKLLSPTKWFSGSDSAEKSKTTSPVQTPSARAVKLTLNKVIKGERLYRNDVIALKKIYADLESNALTTAGNRTQTLAALKAAYNLQPLSSDQKAVLSKFSNPL
jgi:hypothetical protein